MDGNLGPSILADRSFRSEAVNFETDLPDRGKLSYSFSLKKIFEHAMLAPKNSHSNKKVDQK